MNNPPTDAPIEPPRGPVEELSLRMAVASADIAELRAEISRLDRDLDESRRLNLRAAELLDLVYEHLAGAPAPAAAAPASAAIPAAALTGAPVPGTAT